MSEKSRKEQKRKNLMWLMCIILVIAGVMILVLWKTRIVEKQAETVETKQNIEKLTIIYPVNSSLTTEDQMLMEKEVNKIVNEELGVELEFIVASTDETNKNIKRMLTGEEQADIIYASRKYNELVMNGELCELDALLEEYGQGIIKEVGQEYIDACRINGKLYGVPNNRDFAVEWDCYMLRKDILDKYEINPEKITTMDKLEEVFAFVSEKEEDMQMLDTTANSMLLNAYFADGINGTPIGVLMEEGQSETFCNVFETEEYRERIEKVREWYLKGYLGNAGLETTESAYQKIAKGKLFGYAYRGKPGVEQQEMMSCGVEMVCIHLGKSILTSNSPAAMPWAISKNTISPELSMKVLNLLYTNADIMNLLSYGVEGIHYIKTADGHITFPEGKTINPFIGNAWRMPNQFITYVWEGAPLNLWEEMRAFNKNALRGKDFGFTFDITPVSTEYIMVRDIYEKYAKLLENGLVDPEEGIEEMNRELKDNFIDRIIQEKQRQFDAWRTQKEK